MLSFLEAGSLASRGQKERVRFINQTDYDRADNTAKGRFVTGGGGGGGLQAVAWPRYFHVV